MKTFTQTRTKNLPTMTPGVLTLPGDPDQTIVLASLELPWLNNEENVSRIPASTYEIQYLWSKRWLRLMPHAIGVPNRTEIEWHIGNFPEDTEGCTVMGMSARPYGVFDSKTAFGLFDAWCLASLKEGQLFVTITDPPATA